MNEREGIEMGKKHRMAKGYRVWLWILTVSMTLGMSVMEGYSADPEIKVGVIVSSTGNLITQGKNLQNAATLAVDEINRAGGVNGKKIKLIFENDQSDSGKTQAAAKKLIYEDKVLAILGPCGSPQIYAAQQVTEPEKFVLISHVGSSPKLTKEGQKYYFRNSISAEYQTIDLVRYASEKLGYKQFGLAYDPGRTKSDSETFIKDLKGLGLKPVAVVEFQTADVSFGPQLLKLKAARPDAIMVLALGHQMAAFARQAREVGVEARLMGITVIAYDEYIQLAGRTAEGTLAPATFSMAMATDDPKVEKFIKSYKARSNENPEHSSAQAYDAVYVLAGAMKGLSLKPEDLSRDRQAIRDNLEKVRDYQGIAGIITYGPGDHDGYAHPRIIEVKGGEWRLVKTK
jgi:branched-chain amino acid transport system substrate-binding protein